MAGDGHLNHGIQMWLKLMRLKIEMAEDKNCEYMERCPTLKTLVEIARKEGKAMTDAGNHNVTSITTTDILRKEFCDSEEGCRTCPTYGFIRWEATDYDAMSPEGLERVYEERIEDLKRLGLFENNDAFNYEVKDDEDATLRMRLVNFDAQIKTSLVLKRLRKNQSDIKK